MDWRQRFWSKVQVQQDGCWIWTGARNSNGYGHLKLHGKFCKAHRVAYGLEVGVIPEGQVIDHLCRNRACVNPSHLEVVSQTVNIYRSDAWGGENKRKTHCPKGHPYSPENTYIIPANGGRMCRTCKAAGRAAERERRRARASMAQGPDTGPDTGRPAMHPES